jgi:hypothetical protein
MVSNVPLNALDSHFLSSWFIGIDQTKMIALTFLWQFIEYGLPLLGAAVMLLLAKRGRGWLLTQVIGEESAKAILRSEQNNAPPLKRVA